MKRWQREGRHVYVYFDNDQKSAAPADARRLMELLQSSKRRSLGKTPAVMRPKHGTQQSCPPASRIGNARDSNRHQGNRPRSVLPKNLAARRNAKRAAIQR